MGHTGTCTERHIRISCTESHIGVLHVLKGHIVVHLIWQFMPHRGKCTKGPDKCYTCTEGSNRGYSCKAPHQ